jgi:hypothetical protein
VNPHYQQVARRANHRCEYCHAPEAVFNFPFEVEHIIAVAHQGEEVDRETGEVEGKTATGRATIDCLQINNPAQLEARRHWMCLGLFP